MSINTVILKPNFTELLGVGVPFDLELNETVLYKSRTSRQVLNIKPTQAVSKHTVNISAKDGYLYLTNCRFIFITASQGDIDTFLIHLKLTPYLQFSHELKSPWFGANYWQFLFFSVKQPSIASDGFPKEEYFQGTIQFNDGGLFDFIKMFDNTLNNVINNSEIDDQLPRYSA